MVSCQDTQDRKKVSWIISRPELGWDKDVGKETFPCCGFEQFCKNTSQWVTYPSLKNTSAPLVL